jgi:hypothetical protein
MVHFHSTAHDRATAKKINQNKFQVIAAIDLEADLEASPSPHVLLAFGFLPETSYRWTRVLSPNCSIVT